VDAPKTFRPLLFSPPPPPIKNPYNKDSHKIQFNIHYAVCYGIRKSYKAFVNTFLPLFQPSVSRINHILHDSGLVQAPYWFSPKLQQMLYKMHDTLLFLSENCSKTEALNNSCNKFSRRLAVSVMINMNNTAGSRKPERLNSCKTSIYEFSVSYGGSYAKNY
jgi:hypothetical protein